MGWGTREKKGGNFSLLKRIASTLLKKGYLTIDPRKRRLTPSVNCRPV